MVKAPVDVPSCKRLFLSPAHTPFWGLFSLIVLITVISVAIGFGHTKSDVDFIEKVTQDATATFEPENGKIVGDGLWTIDQESIKGLNIAHSKMVGGEKVYYYLDDDTNLQNTADKINGFLQTHKDSLSQLEIGQKGGTGLWAHLISKVSGTQMTNTISYITMGLAFLPQFMDNFIGVTAEKKQVKKDYDLDGQHRGLPSSNRKEKFRGHFTDATQDMTKADAKALHESNQLTGKAGMYMNGIVLFFAGLMVIIGLLCYNMNMTGGYGRHNMVFMSMIIQGVLLLGSGIHGYRKSQVMYELASAQENEVQKNGLDLGDVGSNNLQAIGLNKTKLTLGAVRSFDSNSSFTATQAPSPQSPTNEAVTDSPNIPTKVKEPESVEEKEEPTTAKLPTTCTTAIKPSEIRRRLNAHRPIDILMMETMSA